MKNLFAILLLLLALPLFAVDSLTIQQIKSQVPTILSAGTNSANFRTVTATNFTGNGASLTNLTVLFGTNVAFCSPSGNDALARTNALVPFQSLQSAVYAAASSKSVGVLNTTYPVTNIGRVLMLPGIHYTTDLMEFPLGVSVCGLGSGISTLQFAGGAPTAYLAGNNTFENLSIVVGDINTTCWWDVETGATNIIFRNCKILATYDLIHPASASGAGWTFEGCEIYSAFDRFLSAQNDTNSSLTILNSSVYYNPEGRLYAPGQSNQADQCHWFTRIENTGFYFDGSVTNGPSGDAVYGFAHGNAGGTLTMRNVYFDFLRITNTGAVYITPPALAHMARTNGATVLMDNVTWREPSGNVYTYSTTTNVFRDYGSGSYTPGAAYSTNLAFAGDKVEVTLPAGGVYLVSAEIGGTSTISTSDSVTAKLRKTSGAQADLAGTEITYSFLPADFTGVTESFNLKIPAAIHTVQTNDVISIYVVSPYSEVTYTYGNITAIKVQ